MNDDDQSPTPAFSQRRTGMLPDVLDIRLRDVGPGQVYGEFDVERKHMAPNGFLHAASVIALVDTACGHGCFVSLPEGASGFTTVELKSNFLGTARSGRVTCEARQMHSGRTTQVWDAEAVHHETGKTIALFRCTQMVLWPKG